MRRVAGGFVVGGFTDHHVHLQLVDTSLLAESALGRVVDLGGDPRVLASLEGTGVEVAFAGAFLTPAGGYPSDRAWAPDRSVREIADADAAARAVAEMRDAGAVCIKVADNSTAGPVFDDELFAAIVELADAAGLPLVVPRVSAPTCSRTRRSRSGSRTTRSPSRRHPCSGFRRSPSTVVTPTGSRSTTCADSMRPEEPCCTARTWATARRRSV
jgi:hypothetical protein